MDFLSKIRERILLLLLDEMRNANQPTANFLSMKAWGQTYDERYPSWDREGKMTRPSPSEVEIYKQFLSPVVGENKRILVLGPTPELRDIVAENDPVVVDISFKTIISASSYLKKASIDNETWIKCDWMKLPFPPAYFDVIIGDLVSNQFPPGEREEKFLDTIKNLCTPSGHFISRFMFKRTGLTKEQLENRISFLCAEPSLLKREKIFAVVNNALAHTCDDDLRLNNLYSAWRALEEILSSRRYDTKTKNIVKDSIVYLKENGFPGGRWWTPPSEKNLISLLNKYFVIKNRGHAQDYPDAPYFPIMDCVPRK